MYFFISKEYIPKKRFGQNFLYDRKIINQIMNVIFPRSRELFIEIGPGFGSLTKPMCNIVEQLIVVELDKDLLHFLKQNNFYNKLQIFLQDINTFNFKKIFKEKKILLRIFGNLPYNISVKFLLYSIQFSEYFFDLNIMLQKEVSKRLLASIGSKEYGRLSIILQCYYDIFFCFEILPKSFFPIPKVKSHFIRIKPKVFPLYPINQCDHLRLITWLAFQKRRKMIRNSLSSIFTENMLINLGINPCLRAENLSVYQYCKLAYFFNKYL
ncbi:16S rRNA (adenine(1518)-N(6)/adenine(1519)-N(6))-dimethyltransferase RsmA [Buchnera aphidicola]|uniref:16S rRNA (adenine(1518)-N(6)/adenine(1519)-N(6))- dimethyltransferase RsmA n=1 Tax=Buchnera aphidicola TaxID=9 RepID=UPI0034641CAA